MSTAAIPLAPSTPMSLPSSLPASAEGRHVRSVHWGADLLWDGVEMCAVPQLLQRPVVLDAARDDDGRGDAQLLVREVDLLGGLGALELVNRQRVAVDAA